MAVTTYFRIERDEIAQLIRATGNGFWTVRTLDRQFDKLEETIGSSMPRWRTIKVIVDLETAKAQTADVIARVNGRTGESDEPAARVAIVSLSSPVMLQMRRAVERMNHRFLLFRHALPTAAR